LKVLFPIGSIYPSQQGGPSNSIYWLAKALVANGVDVVIVSTDAVLDAKIERNKWLITNYGKVIFYKDFSLHIPLKAIRTAFIEMKDADVVHLNSIFYPYSWIMGLLALIKKKKIIWSVRGELEKNALIYSSWKKKWHLALFKSIFSKKAIFHVTVPEEDDYTRLILGQHIKSVVIPNYMVLPHPLKLAKEVYFSYIGRIHPIKAIENLIEAVSLSDKFMASNFLLKIAGNTSNDYGIALKEQVKKLKLEAKVIFVGHLEGQDKEQFLSASYFNFMPSHNENFGLVVIESLAQGTPVVASKGTPWIVLEKQNAGFWVGNTPIEIATVMNKLLSLNDEEYAFFLENAFNIANSFDIYANIDKWINAYK
jgi:glycosyltransferase involved in cell wall biosynthesis